eukprot:CFRG7135T1
MDVSQSNIQSGLQAMNLSVLQRNDSSISNIILTAKHVVVYQYDEGRGWKKVDMEGSLFVYRRSITPNFGFFLMNRMGIENINELVTTMMKIKVEPPYLLYRNETGSIMGIWFYNDQDRISISECLVSAYAQEESTSKLPTELQWDATHNDQLTINASSNMARHTNSTGQNLLEMLSQSQTENTRQLLEKESQFPQGTSDTYPSLTSPVAPLASGQSGPDSGQCILHLIQRASSQQSNPIKLNKDNALSSYTPHPEAQSDQGPPLSNLNIYTRPYNSNTQSTQSDLLQHNNDHVHPNQYTHQHGQFQLEASSVHVGTPPNRSAQYQGNQDGQSHSQQQYQQSINPGYPTYIYTNPHPQQHGQSHMHTNLPPEAHATTQHPYALQKEFIEEMATMSVAPTSTIETLTEVSLFSSMLPKLINSSTNTKQQQLPDKTSRKVNRMVPTQARTPAKRKTTPASNDVLSKPQFLSALVASVQNDPSPLLDKLYEHYMAEFRTNQQRSSRMIDQNSKRV